MLKLIVIHTVWYLHCKSHITPRTLVLWVFNQPILEHLTRAIGVINSTSISSDFLSNYNPITMSLFKMLKSTLTLAKSTHEMFRNFPFEHSDAGVTVTHVTPFEHQTRVQSYLFQYRQHFLPLNSC